MVSLGVHQLLNTLYVMTEGSYVHVDHETLRVELEGKTQLRVPVHHLGAVVCFGNVLVSPAAIHLCATEGRELVFLDRWGRFRGRVVGPTSGNVLLRLAQHQAFTRQEATLDIARAIVAGKVQNARQVLLRGARDSKNPNGEGVLRQAADHHAEVVARLQTTTELNGLRGHEGEAAQAYFGAFRYLIREERETFRFDGRNRRPPRDPVNTLLSFIYALLLTDCVGALEGVGLDPQIGYLHAARPGRPALALDLQEELRAPVADRLVLTLINRKQLGPQHFEERTGGAVRLTDEARRSVVVAYQKRKAEEVRHHLLDRKIRVGLIPHVQARLLARHLRGDLEHYVPYTLR